MSFQLKSKVAEGEDLEYDRLAVDFGDGFDSSEFKCIHACVSYFRVFSFSFLCVCPFFLLVYSFPLSFTAPLLFLLLFFSLFFSSFFSKGWGGRGMHFSTCRVCELWSKAYSTFSSDFFILFLVLLRRLRCEVGTVQCDDGSHCSTSRASANFHSLCGSAPLAMCHACFTSSGFAFTDSFRYFTG